MTRASKEYTHTSKRVTTAMCGAALARGRLRPHPLPQVTRVAQVGQWCLVLPHVPREVCGRRERLDPRLACLPGQCAVRAGALPGVDVLLRAAELALAYAMPMV